MIIDLRFVVFTNHFVQNKMMRSPLDRFVNKTIKHACILFCFCVLFKQPFILWTQLKCIFFYKYLIIVEIVLFLQQHNNYVQITYSSFTFFVWSRESSLFYFSLIAFFLLTWIHISNIFYMNAMIPFRDWNLRLKFKNPVGLAAGFDKDAKLYKELSLVLVLSK
jgi:hypothetical protein